MKGLTVCFDLKSKYHLGDVFVLKYSRDTIPLKVVEVIRRNGLDETEYSLKPVRYNGEEITLGESALEELYYIINWKRNKT